MRFSSLLPPTRELRIAAAVGTAPQRNVANDHRRKASCSGRQGSGEASGARKEVHHEALGAFCQGMLGLNNFLPTNGFSELNH